MYPLLTLSASSRITAGTLMLAVVAIESGGLFMFRVVTGRQPATDFQKAFFRAGHAHAGVLVTLALVATFLADATGLDGLLGYAARTGVAWAAILMSAGFFLSALGRDAIRPNRLVVLLYLGALSLAVGAISLGIGLLTA